MSADMSETVDTKHNCESCALGAAVERREFLRDAALRALAAIGAVSLISSRAAALSAEFVTGVGLREEKAYPIPAGDGVLIDKSESVIVARAANRAYAFSLACPHQNTALRWQEGHNRFQCPKHKSRYEADGRFIEGRATRSMDRFAVRRDGEQLLVNLDALYREDDHPAQWSAAFVQL